MAASAASITNPPLLSTPDASTAPSTLPSPTPTLSHPKAIDFLDVTYYTPGSLARTKQFIWNYRSPASVAVKFDEVILWPGRIDVPKTVLLRRGKRGSAWVEWVPFRMDEFLEEREKGRRSIHLKVMVRAPSYCRE